MITSLRFLASEKRLVENEFTLIIISLASRRREAATKRNS